MTGTMMTDGTVKPLLGKAAVVTGSTSGIGLGIARALAEAGADVMLNGFGDAAAIERTRLALSREAGRKIVYDGADLTKPQSTIALIDHALTAFGTLDIVVNNAGVQHVEPIESFPPEKWDLILTLNLSAAFHTTRKAFPSMKARGFGRIINIASAHGLVASPFKSAYVAAKHGLVGLTKVTALEGAPHGITANAICPGYVHTPLVEKQIDEQAKAHGIPREAVIRDVLLAQQAVKEFVTVEELGQLCVLLSSDSGRSITGTALPVDGGWTAH